MIFFKLAFQSLRNRFFTSLLTVLSIALSVSLLLTIERANRAAEEGFTQTISKTDLIVGARSGPLQLIMYTVFNMGNATHNVSYESYEKVKQNPAIAWTIPYSLGDGHRGFRVVGTNNSFFEHYHFRGDRTIEFSQGQKFQDLWDVVVGADVAKKLDYKLGDKIIVSHGVTKGEGLLHHDDKPFVVKGILKSTGTPLDRSVYVSLQGIEALHLDWADGGAPTESKRISPETIKIEDLKVNTITAFFVGATSRIETLRLQREINTFKEEPLLAIIPGATLSELWHNLSYVEKILRFISLLVVGVGFVSMLIALTTSLNERRREMAILRAVGAKSSQIVGLLVFESLFLTIAGILVGVGIAVLSFSLLAPWLENNFGLYLTGPVFTYFEYIYLVCVLVGGALIGLIPAFRAQRQALKDGLSIKT